MKMNEYQKRARKTVIYSPDFKITYPALGLAGECGEVCEKIKKWVRGDEKTGYGAYDTPSEELVDALELELGDVLWYVANLASDLDLDLDVIATKNIDKLLDRQRRDVIKGDGDDR